MKNILLHVHDDEGQESRLQAALDVARAVKGHLDCLDVQNLPLIVSSYYSEGSEAVLLAAERQRESANRAWLNKRLVHEEVSWSMGETYGTFADALSNAADLADLIVLSARTEEGPDKRRYLDRLPLKARRPILAVPPSSEGLKTNGSVLIAWDGSRPCCEAVRAAVPFLKLAKEVSVLQVNQREGALAMAEVAIYLSRHDVPVELVERSTVGTVAETIIDQSSHCGAAMIVMGAYSNPRAAEAVFGGVTRTMLLNAEVPLLLAH